MTPQAQRIAIAEAHGMQWCIIGTEAEPYRMLCWWSPLYDLAKMTEPVCNPDYMWDHGNVPDYLNDLNAMHEAEKVLTDTGPDGQWAAYRIKLISVCLLANCDFLHATASRRAEAFLRTLGKWEDAQ